MAGKKSSRREKAPRKARSARTTAVAESKRKTKVKFPLHPLEASLRIPKAILEQNAGKKCTDSQAAKFLGLSSPLGAFGVELSSAIKYRLLERSEPQTVQLTDLGRKILKPQKSEDELEGRREAVIEAPVFGDVYKHYRGENVPDTRFFRNALLDTFGIAKDRVEDFESIFVDNLRYASLLSEDGDKRRVLDVSESIETASDEEGALKTRSKSSGVKAGDTCFVMQPFKAPLGEYYAKVFVPAIEKAGLKPVRADDDMFATGKIVEQIWRGINAAKVLVAELSTRNPNVFYELGLAHALDKPVVLVSSNEEDVPFDLRHIRVIYYDTSDPFWGKKLIDKIAENVVSALKNPEEALFKKLLS
jgi:hypothetical protein